MNRPMRCRVKKGSRGLTLTHGAPGPDGVRGSEEARAAGRQMGIRFFVGNAGSGDEPLEDEIGRLFRGTIDEVRPDVLYVPTPHHADPSFRTVHKTALKEGSKVGTIFAYDPGDGSSEFRPGVFVPISATIQDKLKAIYLGSICPRAARRGVRTRPRKSP